mmetsp:Transcript_5366/g.10179  ORF Transcript_5366/g.10179 Transcript_5366/m.10179 type:complete len:390 (-) Transcript_5366:138-1307(-)
MKSHGILFIMFGSALASYPGASRGWRGMTEEERAQAFLDNGYTWSPEKATHGWPPVPVAVSEAFRQSRYRLEAQIRSIPTYKLHWDEFFGLAQTWLLPSFTPVGFKKMKAPEHLFKKLQAQYEAGLEKLQQRESAESFSHKPGSTTPKELLPNFIPMHQLNRQVMEELRPLHEEWSGVKLRNGQAYGVRVYKNGSTLVNHVDRSETHVISCIFHVGHDLDEPWPLEIEDHDGKVHAVNMEPGDMVMYESAKQYHARLTPMRGRHYGSVFVHYFPEEAGWNWTMWDVHVAVPPDFLSPEVPAERVEKGGYDPSAESNIAAYFREYWEARGEGALPMAQGIDEPVQSFSHDNGALLFKAPKHLEAATPPSAVAQEGTSGEEERESNPKGEL